MLNYFDQIEDLAGNKYTISSSTEEIPILWDKKRFQFEKCIDLQDLAIFFKIKKFSDLKKEFPEAFFEFEKERSRIETWVDSFSNVGEKNLSNFHLFPKPIAQNFLRSKKNLLMNFWDSLHERSQFLNLISFYQESFQLFDVVRKMNYQVRTSTGLKQVNLIFAENFRFKSVPETLNLFHMKKDLRSCIVPWDQDSFIYAVDFRQFEFRTFLMLAGSNIDFEILDLYQEIGNCFGISKNDSKIKLISHIYSDDNSKEFSHFFDKNEIFSRTSGDFFEWDRCPIFVGRAEEKKKLHTIIQTISYFFYLDRLSEVLKILDKKKSRFIFPLHDSMIFSIHKTELDLIEEIAEILETDIYKIKKYIGPNFLDMEEI